MHSGQSCAAKNIVARDTGLITPGKKNIYNANYVIMNMKTLNTSYLCVIL